MPSKTRRSIGRSMLRRLKRFSLRLGYAVLPARPHDFEQQIFSCVVESGNIVFDVGANLGHVAKFLAKLVGTDGQVFAFEPVLGTYRELVRNASDFAIGKGKVTPFNHGFSNNTGFATISIPDGTHELASLAPVDAWGATQRSTGNQTHLCSFYSLDDFISQPSVPFPHFMKIDVEGAEKLVVAGASGVLSQAARPILFMELFAPWERAFGYGPWEVLQELVRFEYEVFFACPQGLLLHIPTKRKPCPEEYSYGYNILAIPRDRKNVLERAGRLSPSSGTTILRMAPPPQPNA